jgi:hypothetical protein
MKKYKLLLLLFSILLFFGLFLVDTVDADTEGTVTATVTIGVVSVTVAPTTFDYGVMPYSSSKESFDIIDVSGDKNIKATVGTLLTDLDIKGASTADWTLSATSIGADQYMHKFGTSANSTTRPASYTALTTGYDNVLGSDIAANGYVWFGLELDTPSSGTATQQSAVITVLASWAG